MRLLFLLILGSLSSCVFNSSLVKDGEVYLFQGKEQIIVSFSQEPSNELLIETGKVILFIQKKLPHSLKTQSVLIEGLTDDIFSNFFLIADRLFFSTEFYQNKTLIYSYIASLYQHFYHKKRPFIPLNEFYNFTQDKKINDKENMTLLQAAVDYAVKDIYFVSILELFERPQRYFFPQKTKDELFRVLVYPEITTFWNYLNFRFGTQTLLIFSQKLYDEANWKNHFGESINDTEASYVKTLDGIKNHSSLLKNNEIYTTFTNSLQLYMSGTKKSLMKH